MRHTLYILIVTASLGTMAASCKSEDKPAAATSAPTPETKPAPKAEEPAVKPTPASAALTDPQIAAIVVAANQVDIDAGELAVKKSTNSEVKKFAEQMITDHGAVNKAAVELVTKLGVTPEESDASRGLVAGGVATRAKLEALEGDAFDRAYVANEVAYHQAVLAVLDGQLIPSASNAELESTLVSVRPAFVAHLEHAQQIQAALTGGGDAAGHGSAH